MPSKPAKPSRPAPVAFPELEQAMRVIVNTPKAAVEASIAKEQKAKAKRKSKSA
jgi:hypothetical protein